MAAYAVNTSLGGSEQNISSSYKTLISLTAATASLCTAKVYDFTLGASGTPSDNNLVVDISRQTAAGTATSVTPNPLDSSWRAAGTAANVNYSAEGTITSASSVFLLAMNIRASYRWAAAPGSELIIPATNLSGFALRVKSPSGYVSTISASMWFKE